MRAQIICGCQMRVGPPFKMRCTGRSTSHSRSPTRLPSTRARARPRRRATRSKGAVMTACSTQLADVSCGDAEGIPGRRGE